MTICPYPPMIEDSTGPKPNPLYEAYMMGRMDERYENSLEPLYQLGEKIGLDIRNPKGKEVIIPQQQ